MRETPQFEQQDSLAENSKSTVQNKSTFQSQDCSVLTNRKDELDQGELVQAQLAQRSQNNTQVLQKQPASKEFETINGQLEHANRGRTSSVAPVLHQTPERDHLNILELDEITGGTPSTLLNSAKRHMIAIQKSNKRSYKKADETERDIRQGDIEIKDSRFFNKTQSLWNDPHHMSPRLMKFSSHNVDPKRTFKKTVRDINQAIADEKQDESNRKFNFVIAARNQTLDRLSSRKLERFINQYKSSQGLNDEQIKQIQAIEREDPQLFDELSSKKKWTHVQKNGSKALKDQNLNNAYWNQLNHAPKSTVDTLVTPAVLKMDRASCDHLLKAILEEKKDEDFKQNVIQMTRLADRNRMMQKHNDRLVQADKIGVKVKGNLTGISTMQPSVGDTTYNGVSDFQNSKIRDASPDTSFLDAPTSFMGQGSGRTNNSVVPSHKGKTNSLASVEELSQSYIAMQSQYRSPRAYQASDRVEILAMPRPQYHGKDFFQRSEFRGLFLADHQEAIGERAFKCVDELNQDTVSQFNSIGTFKDSISQKKQQQQYYKINTTVKPFIKQSYQNKAQTSVPTQRRSQLNKSPDGKVKNTELADILERKIQTQQGSGFAPQTLDGTKPQTAVTNFNIRLNDFSKRPMAQTTATTGTASSPIRSKNSNPFKFQDQSFIEHQTERNLDLIEATQKARHNGAKGGQIDFVHRQPKALSIAVKNHRQMTQQQKTRLGVGGTRNHIKTNHLSVIDHSLEGMSGSDTTQSILERTFTASNYSSRLNKNLMNKAKSRHPALGNLYQTMNNSNRVVVKSLNTQRNEREKDFYDPFNKNNNVVFPQNGVQMDVDKNMSLFQDLQRPTVFY